MAAPSLPLAPAPGRMSVDFEERVDFARLRAYRLERARINETFFKVLESK